MPNTQLREPNILFRLYGLTLPYRRTVAAGMLCLLLSVSAELYPPLVWQRVPARQVIFVNAMIPRPGETPGAWWDNVGWEQARTTAARRNGYSPDFDLDTYFLHDIPADLRQQMLGHDVAQSPGPFGDKCLFDEWPGIGLHVIAGRDDRFFPVELQQRVARERLGVEPDVVPGGHLAALSRPAELAAALARYL